MNLFSNVILYSIVIGCVVGVFALLVLIFVERPESEAGNAGKILNAGKVFAMPIMPTTCGGCMYAIKVESGELECRRHAPTMLKPSWPTVPSDAWCGEFKPSVFAAGVQYKLEEQA